MEEELPPVDACDQEPCKSRLVAFNNAVQAVEDAVGNINTAKDERDFFIGTTAGGVATVVAGVAATIGSGGTLGFLSGLVIAGGAGTALGSLIRLREAQAKLDAARSTCAQARATLNAASNAVMQNCPRRCWPESFSALPCP